MLPIAFLTILFTQLPNLCRNEPTTFYPLEKQLYDKFLIKYPRNFNNKNEKISYWERLKVFKENVLFVEKLNNESNTAIFEINMFADWTEEEMDALSGPISVQDRRIFRNSRPVLFYKILTGPYYPKYWDWRKNGGVSAVRKQALRCNSCYAHAVADLVESLFAIKYNQNISISEHEIIDCDHYNNGCINGSIANSLAHGQNVGFMQKINYPSLLQNNYHCPKRGEIFLDKLIQIDPDANAMAWFVANVAPVTITFAFPKEFRFYKTGVLLNTDECSTMNVNHAVEVIGYGTECGKDYWMLKNNWGERWGDKGFFKIERGINACKTETYVVSATLYD